ncbi:hypothetical protein M407DRAFT_18389 [Tulasnella calospora MUT 4182]|uniref:Uncharacterized protein n=1 Tax=Tulasnella calospora MUT 4182 TaxID=1051891 RepID=A0A0C3QJT3_9AGAM|nr:hypothetical protein M407DRAFT_18389 [Tulasnella calospora MUT 4182]
MPETLTTTSRPTLLIHTPARATERILLLVEIEDIFNITLELWDLDEAESTHPDATFWDWRDLQGRLLAFAESAGDPLRACILDESTQYSVELAFGIHAFECQRTLDICTKDEVFFVARHRNLELYMTSDVKRALETGGTTARAISPFQTFSYPGDLLHSPQFHSNTPVHFDAPEGSVALAHFLEDEWQAIVDTIQPPRVPENGEGFPGRGRDRTHTLVSWEIPDFGVDLPRPECVAIDEAVGRCAAAMGSGRIWIGDAVPRVKPKSCDAVPLLGRMPHPLIPILDGLCFLPYTSETRSIRALSPSQIQSATLPRAGQPQSIIAGLGVIIPKHTMEVFYGVLPSLEEFVDVTGRIFRITTGVEWVDAYRLIDGTTIEDVIERLKGNRPSRGTRYDQDWMSDYMPVYQHMNWYRIFRLPTS